MEGCNTPVDKGLRIVVDRIRNQVFLMYGNLGLDMMSIWQWRAFLMAERLREGRRQNEL